MMQMVRGAYPFRELDRARFEKVLGMMAGRYPAARFGELRPRVVWNQENGEVRPRPGTRMLAVSNAGAIPDRGYYAVIHSGTGAKVGELDEIFVFEYPRSRSGTATSRVVRTSSESGWGSSCGRPRSDWTSRSSLTGCARSARWAREPH
jgi:Lhr-like helicase